MRLSCAKKGSPLWRAILRARAVGDTAAKIAQDIGVHRSTVERVIQQPEAKAHLAKLLDDMDAELVRTHAMSPWALLVLGGKRRRKATKPPS